MSTDEKAIKAFPARLSMLRHWKQLTQSEVAKATGIHPTAVSHFESGYRAPSLANLMRLVRLLGSPAYLFGLSELPEPIRDERGAACAECLLEGCASCMPQGYCQQCVAEGERIRQVLRDAIQASKDRAKAKKAGAA